MNKEIFLTELHQSYVELKTLLAPLTEAQMTQPNVYDALSIKDVLAHLAAWENLARDWVADSLTGKPVVRFMSGFEIKEDDNDAVMDRLNEHFYRVYKDYPLSQVKADAQAAHRRMVKLVESMDEAHLLAPGRFDWWPDEPVWLVLAGNSFEHYQEHIELIRVWLKAQQQKPT